MKTPIQEFYEFMEQNQYFIGNDLYNKYNELLEKEKKLLEKLEQRKSIVEIMKADEKDGLYEI